MAKIELPGWVLLSREVETPPFGGDKLGPWYIAWHEIFSTKKLAVEFAKQNGWLQPWRAVRGTLSSR